MILPRWRRTGGSGDLHAGGASGPVGEESNHRPPGRESGKQTRYAKGPDYLVNKNGSQRFFFISKNQVFQNAKAGRAAVRGHLVQIPHFSDEGKCFS